MDGWMMATLALSMACVLLACELWSTKSLSESRRERILGLLDTMPTNKHAHMLGRVVQAKVYEGSNWEPMVIVAVSHKGSVAVRPVSDPECSARWIHKSKVPKRVRL